MLSMCIPCNSAGHCTSTKGFDKNKTLDCTSALLDTLVSNITINTFHRL